MPIKKLSNVYHRYIKRIKVDIGGNSKRAIIKDITKATCPNIAILSETKFTVIDNKIVKSLWSWAYVKATGSVESLLVMWDSLNIEVVDVIKGNDTISIQFKRSDDLQWWLTGVYGPASRRNSPDFLGRIIASGCLMLSLLDPSW